MSQLDGYGFIGNIFEYAMAIAVIGSSVLAFIYLWRRGRLDMDQSPAMAMMEGDDSQPEPLRQERSSDGHG